MISSRRRLIFVLSLGVCLSPAVAWEAPTRVAMVDEAARLMPLSLRKALESNRTALRRGMLTPMLDEDGAEHRPQWSTAGTLGQSIEQEIAALGDLLDRPKASFSTIAESFGRLAHYVADSGFPPGMSRGDGAERYKHFAWFCEDRRTRFPLVFYGHDDAELKQGSWNAFGLREMSRAADNDRELARHYAAAGDPPDPSAFDDRSVPFAVGSIAYSRTTTSIARVWLAVWQRASGDMKSLPYRNSKPIQSN